MIGRYFLVEVTDPMGYSIPNPESCVSPPDIMGATLFAPAGSFILAFSGTEGSVPQFAQDGFSGFPETCNLLPNDGKYESYKLMLDVSAALTIARCQAVLSGAPRFRRTPGCFAARRSTPRTP